MTSTVSGSDTEATGAAVVPLLPGPSMSNTGRAENFDETVLKPKLSMLPLRFLEGMLDGEKWNLLESMLDKSLSVSLPPRNIGFWLEQRRRAYRTTRTTSTEHRMATTALIAAAITELVTMPFPDEAPAAAAFRAGSMAASPPAPPSNKHTT